MAAQPGRDEMVADVAAGKMTQAAAARQLNTTPKTVGTWVERFRREQHEPVTTASSGPARAKSPAHVARNAAPERGQLGLPIGSNSDGGEGAAHKASSGSSSAEPVEPALVAKLWQHAADLS